MKFKLFCIALLCLLLPAFAHEGHQRQAVQIAEMKPTNIEIDDTRVSNMHIISAPGASFVKVHFDYFNLPEDAYVVVRNPQGSEVYTYGMTNRDEYTFDPELQEDGWSSFASMSITGQTAIVSLYHESDFSFEDGYGVYVSRYMEGYSNERIQELTGQVLYDDGTVGKSTCGNMQRTDVECYKNSYPTEYERSKSIARLVMGGGLCTAWRVSDDNRMMTNEHCMSTSSAVSGSESWFNYQNSTCGGSSTTTPVKVSGASLLASDYDLDYTLYTVNNFSSIQSFGNLGLDVRTPSLHEEIYIPQHGSGNPKELSIEDDQNSTGICRIDDAIANGRATNSDTGYMCDTIGGSSGSPVLARSSHKVIALHHFGGCNNQGVRIDLIWPQVSSHFGGVIPNGSGGGTGGNIPPSASFTSSDNLLTVSFSDTSTDSDGTIASWAWSFGDGSSSSSQNPTHTYAANGTYNVSLTVTDNDGASSTSTASVTVNDGSGPNNELSCGQTVGSLSGSTGEWQHFFIDVDSTVTGLSFNMSGGSGDADLYVRYGAEPTTSSYDCRPYSAGNNENCDVNSVQAGRYYVSIRAYSSYSNVSLSVSCTTGGGNCTPYSDSVSNISDSQGGWKYYTQDVPACATEFVASISGGSGDADLYTRFGSQPTTSSYACRPYRAGNNETCTATNPSAGTWHLGIRAYSTYSGVTLSVSYQ